MRFTVERHRLTKGLRPKSQDSRKPPPHTSPLHYQRTICNSSFYRVYYVCALCAMSLQLYPTLPNSMAVACPLPMGFSRQEYWSGLPCPPTGYLLNSGIEPMFLMSPAPADGFFTTSATGKPTLCLVIKKNYKAYIPKGRECNLKRPGKKHLFSVFVTLFFVPVFSSVFLPLCFIEHFI